jgi:hypothetical protein
MTSRNVEIIVGNFQILKKKFVFKVLSDPLISLHVYGT